MLIYFIIFVDDVSVSSTLPKPKGDSSSTSWIKVGSETYCISQISSEKDTLMNIKNHEISVFLVHVELNNFRNRHFFIYMLIYCYFRSFCKWIYEISIFDDLGDLLFDVLLVSKKESFHFCVNVLVSHKVKVWRETFKCLNQEVWDWNSLSFKSIYLSISACLPICLPVCLSKEV